MDHLSTLTEYFMVQLEASLVCLRVSANSFAFSATPSASAVGYALSASVAARSLTVSAVISCAIRPRDPLANLT